VKITWTKLWYAAREAIFTGERLCRTLTQVTCYCARINLA